MVSMTAMTAMTTISKGGAATKTTENQSNDTEQSLVVHSPHLLLYSLLNFFGDSTQQHSTWPEG